ncbi:hypothetical protein [Flavobacterium sp. N1994]|uniref:hypothetical protein n=1 Tax=Flavobacterium sp. N1994 TaxID=2986827 RepID=UPI002222B256|nr:hypothetical protein [Flavobacterium sp. N1994]
MEFRYHPILEGLKVNEDGTEIIYLGKKLEPKIYEREGKSIPMQVVNIKYKNITVMRLVNECWNSVSENLDYITKRIDPEKGNHYSNLCWSKQGVGLSHNNSPNFGAKPKFSEQEFKNLKAEIKPGETITVFLKRKKVSTKAYYTAKKKYEKKQ